MKQRNCNSQKHHCSRPHLVRLCKDSFFRKYGEVGYLLNQLTAADRLFDEVGSLFLSVISREPRDEDEVARWIADQFVDAPMEELRRDLEDFLADLAADGFILRGHSESEMDTAEPCFSYGNAQQLMDAKRRLAGQLGADGSTEFSDTQTELSARFKENPILYSLQVELTSACNERCIHCYMPPKRHQQHADAGMVRRIIDEYAGMGGLSFTFGGGECMLHPDFADLLAYARSRDLSVSVLSNLTKLDDRLLAALRDARISQLQVSVYSMNPDEHDHITKVSGSLSRTLRAVERLVEANVPVQISCPVMRTNYRSFKNVLEWAQSRGMKAQSDFIMMARSDFTTDNLSERIDDEQTVELLADILESDKQYKEAVEESVDRLDAADEPVCGVGRGTLTIGADGNCFPCAGWQGMKVGNVSTQSLAEIWKDSESLGRLRKITKDDFPECRVCPDRDYCAMCLVRNFNESGGDMMALPKRFCQVARLNRIEVEKWKENHKSKAAPGNGDLVFGAH